MTKDNEIESGSGSQLPGPGVGFTFLYYFSMTLLVVAGSQGLNLPVGSVSLYRYGLVLGLLAGGIGTYFNRTASFDVSAPEASALKAQIEQLLAELGFELDADATEQQEDYVVYRRSGLASLFSGKVFIAWRSSQPIQIVSRAATLRRLQRSL